MRVPKVCDSCKQWYLVRQDKEKSSKYCSKPCQYVEMGKISGKKLHRKWALESPEETKQKMEKAFEKFFEKTEGCWEWQGAKKSYTSKKLPYGCFTFRNHRNIAAHRISYQLYKGNISKGLIIMHTCDNPPCVNPDHLKEGTYLENHRDKLIKGRCRGEKLTIEKVKEIKKLLKMGVMKKRIVQDFNISRTTLYWIERGKTWNDILID